MKTLRNGRLVGYLRDQIVFRDNSFTMFYMEL
jgi:lauroyl/myristoyl acyltransferase